jgi:hypothetical protein
MRRYHLELMLGTVFLAVFVEAVIGMPWTPMSGAGVARRTVLRTTAVVTTSAAAAASTPVPAPTTVLIALLGILALVGAILRQ